MSTAVKRSAYIALMASLFLSACANKPTYVNSQPSAADAEIVFGGDTYKDRLVLGHFIPRAFAINLDESSFKHCEEYQYSAKVVSKKSIWGEGHEEKSVHVRSGGRVGVMGQYAAIGSDGRAWSCGPMIGIFSPSPSSKYRVDLDVRDGGCRLVIKEDRQGVLFDVNSEAIGKICDRRISN